MGQLVSTYTECEAAVKNYTTSVVLYNVIPSKYLDKVEQVRKILSENNDRYYTINNSLAFLGVISPGFKLAGNNLISTYVVGKQLYSIAITCSDDDTVKDAINNIYVSLTDYISTTDYFS
jgi:hypothetical protein